MVSKSFLKIAATIIHKNNDTNDNFFFFFFFQYINNLPESSISYVYGNG